MFPWAAILYPTKRPLGGKEISLSRQSCKSYPIKSHEVVTVVIISILHVKFSPLFLLYRIPERFVPYNLFHIMLVLIFLAALFSVQHSSAETKVRKF